MRERATVTQEQSAVRKAVDDLLSRRIPNTNAEALSGFQAKGANVNGLICGDCGDGACDGCP